jgi:hypothetical protein
MSGASPAAVSGLRPHEPSMEEQFDIACTVDHGDDEHT